MYANHWSLGKHYQCSNKKQKIQIDNNELLEIDSDKSDGEVKYFDVDKNELPDINCPNNYNCIIQMSIENAHLDDSFLQGSIIEIECNFTARESNSDEPLYNGSSKTVGELLLILEFIKTSSHLGDVTQSLILGIFYQLKMQ